MSEEQRVEPRVNVYWPADASRGSYPALHGHIRNISWGGAQFEAPVACAKGEVMLLEISAQHKNRTYKFRVLAEVVYKVLRPNNLHAMGLRFRKREKEADQFFRIFLGAPLKSQQHAAPNVTESASDPAKKDEIAPGATE
ncbi:MAG TPA: PilZ domain-containing protein [Pseudomonadales bacterium]|nr:PilZ domain-containing protein [Pseudomonadales bacterium]